MSEILFQYHRINPTTWVYVSSLLMIGLFFKFSRFWSVRNLDLVLVISLAPGLLMIHSGAEMQRNRQDDALVFFIDGPPGTLLSRTLAESTPNDANDPNNQLAPGDLPTAPHVFGGLTNWHRLDPSILAGEPPGTLLSRTQLEQGSTASAGQKTGSDQPAGSPVVAGLDGWYRGIKAWYRDDPSLLVSESVKTSMAGALDSPASAPTQTAPSRVKSIGKNVELFGYLWLFIAGGVLLARLLLDPAMVRRPLLDPNLSIGGLTFIGTALMLFLMANVITSTPTDDDLRGVKGATDVIAGTQEKGNELDRPARRGPGYWMLSMLPGVPTSWAVERDSDIEASERETVIITATSKIMAILSHLAIVIGMVLIGYWHFDNIKMGLGAALLYLLLPYTAQMTGYVDHALPAALLIWAVACYRRPLAAGIFLGLAMGTMYYPLYLLPLWISFYWARGLTRFLLGVGSMLLVLIAAMFIASWGDFPLFLDRLVQMFGFWAPVRKGLGGIWNHFDEIYRIPVLVAFIALSVSFAMWPAQKNLGTLLSCTAAVMLASQFWHGYGGGTYIAWYLPLLLLTVFRPNLEDRVASTVLAEGWFPRRRSHLRVA